MWMHRFAGWPKSTTSGKDSPKLVEDWGSLRADRAEADAAIEAWAAGVTQGWLTRPFTRFSGGSGREMTQPAWLQVAHLFNH